MNFLINLWHNFDYTANAFVNFENGTADASWYFFYFLGMMVLCYAYLIYLGEKRYRYPNMCEVFWINIVLGPFWLFAVLPVIIGMLVAGGLFCLIGNGLCQAVSSLYWFLTWKKLCPIIWVIRVIFSPIIYLVKKLFFVLGKVAESISYLMDSCPFK